MRKFTKRHIFKFFIQSYSGKIAIIGLLVLALQISGEIWSFDKILGGWWKTIATPILPSVIASVIFYFISYYWPNVLKNKVDAKEIKSCFDRLEQLNTYTLMSLGLGVNRLFTVGRFKYPSKQEMIKAAEGKTVWGPPDLKYWKDDKIYEKIINSPNWVEYLSVIVNEEIQILDAFEDKITLHPTVREKILQMKGHFGFRSTIETYHEIEKYSEDDPIRNQYEQLSHLLLCFCLHVSDMVEMENLYYESVYSPL